MSIYRGAGGASDATNDATVNAVAGYASAAASSATNAATSAANAATSAGAANTSVTSATTQASNAATSASNAASSASSAAGSVTSAATQASNAATSASNASTSASNASTSASSASTSATAASSAASASSASAGTATTKATEAAASAASALAIYGNTTAMNAAVTASQTAASNAATSASSAATSAASALVYKDDAAGFASDANASYIAAASAAAYAATTVAGFDGNVASAITSAANASASASAAATSANNASTSATQAAASAAGATAIVTGVASTRPSIRPSLLLDFANTRVLDPRITFTRASTATFYDNDSSAVAEQNLLTYSQEFDNAAWVKASATITANTSTAPDGTTTAETINEGTASAGHNINQSFSLAANTTYTLSCFAKNIDGQYIVLGLRGGASTYAYATFNLSIGTVTISEAVGTGYSVTSTSITDAGNSWYRCVLTIVTGTTISGTNPIRISMSDGTTITSDAIPSYTGTNRSIYIWGAQLEQRSAVTAYTPTTTAAITNYIPVLQTAASGAARFDCNPVTRESLGLLIEESRTNLLTYSSDYTQAAWTKSAVTVTNTVNIAPDGSQTASLVGDTAATSSFLLAGTATLITATSYTFSVYAKAQSNSLIQLTFDRVGSGNYANFNLSTGVISKLGSSSTAVISPAGNGWYKCSITATTVNGGAGSAKVYLINDANSVQAPSYTGTGLLSVFLWGAQLEVGAFATSYIPTVASQVTRAADAASMTGTNFSSWYNIEQGSIYISGIRQAVGQTLYRIDDGSATSNSIYSSVGNGGSGQRHLQIFSSSVSQASIDAGDILANTAVSLAGAYATNNFAVSFNGATVGTDTSGTIQVNVNRLLIAENGTTKRIAYYPVRLSNTELQGLTA